MKGKDVKKDGVIVEKTISRAKELGEILRKSNNNVIKKVLEYLENEFGYAEVLIKGKVSEIVQTVQGGFDVGIIKVKDEKAEKIKKVKSKKHKLNTDTETLKDIGYTVLGTYRVKDES